MKYCFLNNFKNVCLFNITYIYGGITYVAVSVISINSIDTAQHPEESVTLCVL